MGNSAWVAANPKISVKAPFLNKLTRPNVVSRFAIAVNPDSAVSSYTTFPFNSQSRRKIDYVREMPTSPVPYCHCMSNDAQNRQAPCFFNDSGWEFVPGKYPLAQNIYITLNISHLCAG
jgi:hypothetical protein